MVDFVAAHVIHQNLVANVPVAETQMHAAGFNKPVLDAAKSLGLNWATLIQLALQYGPQLLQILLALVAGKTPVKP